MLKLSLYNSRFVSKRYTRRLRPALGLLVLLYNVSFTVVIASPADAVVYRYVSTSGGAGTGCNGPNQNTAGNDPGIYQSLTEGLACMQSGNHLRLKGGTYHRGLSDELPSGSNESNRTVMEAVSGETVWLTANIGTGAKSYITFDRINLDGGTTTSNPFQYETTAFSTNYGSDHIIFQNAEIKRWKAGIFIVGSFHIIRNINAHTLNGGSVAGDVGHGFYVGSNDSIYENNYIHDNCGAAAYGIHLYSRDTNPSRNIFRYNRINNVCGPGIGVINGFDNRVYNNIVYNNQIGIWLLTTRGLIYNNTVYNNANTGISVGYPQNIIANNVLYSNETGLEVYPHHGPISGVTVINNLASKNRQNFKDRTGSGIINQGNLFGDVYDLRLYEPSAADSRQ
jgi:hypothetical protein